MWSHHSYCSNVRSSLFTLTMCSYLTIIPYPTSASGIIVLLKHPKNCKFWAPQLFSLTRIGCHIVVNGIWAHIPLSVNQPKLRNCNIPLPVFNKYIYYSNVYLCSRNVIFAAFFTHNWICWAFLLMVKLKTSSILRFNWPLSYRYLLKK